MPWIFLYRDPIETIVSNLADVPPWLIDSDRRVLASITGVSPEQVEEMRVEELCARTIGSFYSLALRVANDEGLLLNYNQLSVPVISRILRFFDVNPSAEEMETILRGSRIYSKEVSGTRTFVADARAKQKLANDLVHQVTETWATEPYRLLEQKRLEQSWM